VTPGPGDRRKSYDDILAHVSHKRRRRRAIQRRRSRRSVFATMLAVIAIAGAVLLSAGAVAGALAVNDALSGVDLETLTADPPGVNTRIYDRNGDLLAVLPSTENRTPVASDQISPLLKNATVAVEDRRFYEHDGVDLEGVMRAALENLEAGEITQGASTIEQQLVRNLYLSDEKSWTRKIQEAWLARQLSDSWTKDQILTEYLNVVPYGAITYGCEAAALQYFGVSCANLKLWQAATLAGIPQNPLVYNPVENPKAAKDRRNEVLDRMLDEGYITQAQHDKAAGHRMELKKSNYLETTKQGYFVAWVRTLLQQDDALGRKAIKAGLSVKTTLDADLQQAAKIALTQELDYTNAPAGALVAIDPRTGEVLAMESSTNYNDSKYNLAVQGTRQSGSTFKTFGLTAAIADEKIDPDTTQFMSGPFTYDLVDPPVNPATDIWEVDSSHVVNGGETLHDATVASDNTVFARLSIDLGYKKIQDMAYRLGISRNPGLPDAYSIVLGTGDVSVLDMTHAYATLAAQGVRRDVHALLDVRAMDDDRRILSYKPDEGKRVIPDGAAYEVSRILQDNARYGTGAASQTYLAGRTVAGKTGTTTNNWDAWFCGYSTNLAACVWVGYPKAAIPMGSEIWGGSIPVNVWARFMSTAFDQEPQKFPEKVWPLPRNPIQYEPFTSEFPIAVAPPPVAPCDPKAKKPCDDGDTGGGSTDGDGGGGSTGGGGPPPPST
jgi:penicillin-binding protein 1A